MDFHLATPTGDVYLFSYDGHDIQFLTAKANSVPVTAAGTDAVEQECSMLVPT